MATNQPYQRGDSRAAVSVRLPKELLEKIDAAAEADDRTRSGWLARIITEALESYNWPKEPSDPGDSRAKA